MNPSNIEFISSTSTNNNDASAPKRLAISQATPRLNAAAMAMTSGARIISRILPKYPTTGERLLPPKKRQVPVDHKNDKNSVVPTTILLRQVASYWNPPTVVSRESSTSGSPFYLERYCEKALDLYPQGPQNLFRHCIEPCADPADLQRRHDENQAAKKAASDVTENTAATKYSTATSISTKKKYTTSKNLSKKDKPAKDKNGEKDKTVPSRQGAVPPPSPSTAAAVPRQTHDKFISTTSASKTTDSSTATSCFDLATSRLKRKTPRNKSAAPAADTRPMADDKSSMVPPPKATNPTGTTTTDVRQCETLLVHSEHVPLAVPRGGSRSSPLRSAPPGPDRSLTPPAVRPMRKTDIPPRRTTTIEPMNNFRACPPMRSVPYSVAAMAPLPVNFMSKPQTMPREGPSVYHSGTFD
eukprot:scaffold19629_cov147-Amphora_coffeaeformis.AAC.3